MNYLAGIFLIYYKQEELAYKMLCQLLELRMMSTFTDNFQNLQMNFYTVDRLNELFIPELWQHFKEERLVPVFYCSSWFITIFTNTLQYTDKSHIVEWVMDFYFSEGLKGLLKCIVVILKHLKRRFVKISFDQIMNHLSDLTKKELFTNIQYVKYIEDKKTLNIGQLENKYKDYWSDFKFLDNFRDKVNKVALSSNLITHLQTKYKTVNERLKSKI